MKDLLNKIHHADCLEFMKQLPDKSIDLIITDPPFGIGSFWGKYSGGKRFGKRDWNDAPPSKEYFDEIFRISKNQIVWGGNLFTSHLQATSSWVIWDKGRNIEKTKLAECEMAWTSFKTPARIVSIKWDGGKKGPETGTKTIHPCQRPVYLYEWCLDKFGHGVKVAMDPFSGSGSFALAACRLDIDFICVEKAPEYYESSCRRLLEYKSQQKVIIKYGPVAI